MLITILTTGSRGDTQPYIALGQALQKAGCRVRLAAFENFAAFVAGAGLEFFPIHGDVAAIAASPETRHAMQADNPLKLIASFNKLKTYVFDLQKDYYAACEGADAVIYHPGATIGYFAARQMNVPAVLAAPFPMAPTRAYPALMFYTAPRLGGMFNLLTHKLFQQVMWTVSSAPVRQFWQARFGHAPQDFANPFTRQVTAARPTIISCSPQVFAPPADWPAGVFSPGYWFMDEPAWTPPDALQAFLQSGPAPVYAGFGSVGDPAEAANLTSLVIEALRQAGQRGVLATGWSGMARPADLPESIFMLESAPHTWLFPRMAAVIHHGGAGTTAAGLRAGVPTVVVPFSNDQFAWGRRVAELGVGAPPVPRKSLTAARLAQALRMALEPPVQTAARAMGARIAAEDGAAQAARVVLRALGAG